MLRIASCAALVAVVLACGPRAASRPAGPLVTDGDGAGTATVGEPPPPDPPPPPPPPPPLTRDECGQLVDRMLAIGVAEQQARDPRAPAMTTAQHAAVRDRLLAEAEPTCAAMARATWQCAVTAADRAAMAACEQVSGP